MSGVEFIPPPTEFPDGPDDAYPPPPAQPDEPPRPRRLWLRSLQSRLVIGVVSLVLVLVIAVGTTTYYVLSYFLYKRLDEQLAATATRRSVLALLNPPSPRFGSGVVVPQQVWVAILSNDTDQPTGFQPIGQDVTSLHLSDSTYRQLADHGTGPTSRRTSDGQWVRTVSMPGYVYNETEQVTVVLGLSESELRRTLRSTLFAEILIGSGALLIAFVVTTWGVRRSLRNLYAVTGTARDVAAELSPTGAGLDRRVPVVEEGTEVGQLAESMNTLLAAVETQFAARLESEHRMRQFLADASHELRTPLTSIRGYAELARMQRAAAGVPDDDDGDNLHRIESEGTRMSRLVDDLLLLARSDADDAAPAMHRELVDVPEVLDDAVSGSRAAYPDRPISLEVLPVPAVLGDRDQLLRVVRNLVNNAAVHTEPGRPIAVRAFTDAGGAVITVADGGPGLPPEQAAHVFERFWRADKARTRARGGSGLGLSIVATIVRQHGGSVRFDSTVEAGSTVTVWLPAAG
jgi:two-component system OmpR family sensor kinase